jgi:hypothetical protein
VLLFDFEDGMDTKTDSERNGICTKYTAFKDLAEIQ